ncbi:MAG: DUF3106 domain-containing protein [Bacteroidota bacterium]|nr:DUF3106 domain-containing protein [Bacteroidota bacterium]
MRRLFYEKRAIFIPLAIIGFAAIVALIGFVVMSLWNWLLPGLFHVGIITFWQALGIFALCKILFGFGKGHRGGAPWMRNKMADRFKNMTPEEKEKFKEQMRSVRNMSTEEKLKFKQQMGYGCGWGKWDVDAWEGNKGNNAPETPKASE